ncbi:MAG: IPT/TIG domain-containing protein [Cyclobacteriaceae bacterium]|nr:IPT/TIG domain-containing protein [Cyclobacteriaceae bacterium]
MKTIIKYKIHFIIFLLTLGSLTYFSSCQEEEKPSQIVLLSFGPSGVNHGDEITFFGQNLDKVTSIVLRPNVEVPKSSFKSVSAERINIVVPEAAEAGTVILKTPQGDIESKTILNFNVPVVIESITAEAKPGTNITITGEKINWIEEITFPSDLTISKDDFVSRSLTEVVVTVPMEAQSGFLIFRLGGTTPLTFGSEEQLIVTLPTVTSVDPQSIRHTGTLTISGTNLDLITTVRFEGGTEVGKANFTSHSETEIKLAVPATAKTGALTLKQASPVELTTPTLTIILPAGTALSPTPAKPGIDEITITGTDLDLVAKLVLPGAGDVFAASFISQTATEIKLAVPASATQGAIDYVTVHGYAGPLGVVLRLPPTGSFPTLDYYIYRDGLQSGWSAWGGWGHVSQDFNNTENPANGTMAIKSVFNDAYGAIQIHNGGSPGIFSGYNYLVFYVLVVGQDSEIIVQIDNNADFYPPAFTKDKYHQIVVPLASLAGANNVTELRIKNNNTNAPTNNTIVFIDEIGLTIDEPQGLLPDLAVAIYDDQINDTHFGFGGGWGGTTTVPDSDENQRGGEVSIKATFAGGWGGAAQFGSWGKTPLSTAGMQYLSFSIFGGTGTDGRNIQLSIKPTTDGATSNVQVTIRAGKWTDYAIPLSELGNPSSIGELFFQDTDWSGTVFIDHIGLQ